MGSARSADSELPDALRATFADACHEIRDIEARIKQVERQLEAMAQQLPVVEHLLTIPGIGLLTATALFAFIGDIRRFPSGRHLASWLGLTPREYSSGLKRHLGRISKRGDGYLRTLLIHGARSTLLHARTQQPDHLREWAHKLAQTHVHNKAAVAVANKVARIVWAVLRLNGRFEGRTPPEAATESRVTAEQVGPAPGQPITIVALEAAVNDWLSGARIPSWPGALGSSNSRGRRYVCSPPRSDARLEPS